MIFLGLRKGWTVISLLSMAMVVGGGYLWAIIGPVRGGCEIVAPWEGRIVERRPKTDQEVQYVVTDHDHCRVLVTLSYFPLYSAGDEVTFVDGTLQNVRDISYTGYQHYLERRDVSYTWRYPKVVAVAQSHSLVPTVYERVRTALLQTFKEPEGSFVVALFLAEAGLLPARLQEQFRLTGVSHIVAISGFNISLLAGSLLFLLQPLPLSNAWRHGISLVVLWTYIMMIGWPISAVRAMVFWTVWLFSRQWHLLVSLPTVLLLALVSMVTAWPLIFYDIGFQLSLGAVAGIGLMLFLARGRPMKGWNWLRLSVLTTLGASLATWPIIVWHFGTVSFISILANLLVVPVTPLITWAAMLTIFLHLVWPPLALLGSWSVRLMLMWMDFSTYWLSHVPGAALENVVIPWYGIVAYYSLLFLGAVIWLRWQGRSWREVWE